ANYRQGGFAGQRQVCIWIRRPRGEWSALIRARRRGAGHERRFGNLSGVRLRDRSAVESGSAGGDAHFAIYREPAAEEVILLERMVDFEAWKTREIAIVGAKSCAVLNGERRKMRVHNQRAADSIGWKQPAKDRPVLIGRSDNGNIRT